MYDLRTRVVHASLENRPWPEGAQDLFGNHHIYVAGDRSVWVKDLQTGRSTKYRAAGGRGVWAVAVHGPWLAWVTACAGDGPCSQTLTIRNTATGATTTVATRGTTTLDLSGGYLALDVVPGTQRQLRTIKLGTATSTAVGSLPGEFDGIPPDNFNAGPRQFDLDDETLAWVGADHRGRIVQLGAVVDPAKYLGNVIAPGSFSPDGDGRGDAWTVALPVSKALPTCTVTIYRGTTKVRILSCANTTGMVAVTWDGRTGSGAKLPTGRYTYRVSGRDSDGTWLRSYDGTLTTIWGPIDKTA